jgi:magnesium transporter
VRTLITTSGKVVEPTDERIAACRADAGREGFWLDILAPDEGDYQLLRGVFNFHPLTIEDIQDPNERPKLDEYDEYLFAVVFTGSLAGDDIHFLEQHIYGSKRMVVTVHHEPQPELDALRERIRQGPEITKGEPGSLLYLIVDALVDTMFPVLDRMDDTIDRFQDEVIEGPTPQVLRRIYDLKHTVFDLRRQVGAQRDLLQRLTTRAIQLHPETGVYYRDIYDHVIRQYETADSLRDLLTGTMDVYLSTVSNRQNVTMQQLTVIASLFLPLSFLSGFFGMNFGFLVNHITTGTAFALAVSLMAAVTVVQLLVFRLRRLV